MNSSKNKTTDRLLAVVSFFAFILISCSSSYKLSIEKNDIKSIRYGSLTGTSPEMFDYELRDISSEELAANDTDNIYYSSLTNLINQDYGEKKQSATMDNPSPVQNYSYQAIKISTDEKGESFLWLFLLKDENLASSSYQSPYTAVYRKDSSVNDWSKASYFYSDSYSFIKPFENFLDFLDNSFSSKAPQEGKNTSLSKL
jgi:hypothetical protein